MNPTPTFIATDRVAGGQGLRVVRELMSAMDLRKELDELRREVSQGLNARATGSGETGTFDEVASQLKTVATELAELVRDQESEIETIVAQRPVAALASAFAVGIIVGLLLRRA